MKMQIDILKKGNYGFNLKGSKALNLMMDNETPKIDLLVRESIQNSADATLNDKKGCIIQFDLVSFDSKNLAAILDVAGTVLDDRYGHSERKCLVITDRLTTGLLGGPDEEEDKPNNLYKLVYSFLESGKNNDYSGGSWGIGKSVYYRFGIGMVFYYSRTLEEGTYHEKLAGAIIENETSSEALLRAEGDSCGIAFFGKNITGRKGLRSVPIDNHVEIEEFLKIFNIPEFKETQTGTKIIIPYFDSDSLIESRNNNEYVSWDNDFKKSMEIAIQRWYFPRIENEGFNGKFIRVKVCEKIIQLNDFFSNLQKLYMGQIEGVESLEISTSTFNEKIGTFYYKKFTKTELGIETPPNNLPSPYAFFDMDNERDDVSNNSIIVYTRKPGMIVTYDDTKTFTSIKTSPEEYLIGIFVLNDDAEYKGEKIGNYFKEVEKANHKVWADISSSENIQHITTLKSKPFKCIKNQIARELNAKFGRVIPDEVLSKNSALQKKLGDILLPAEDFGKDKEPTIKRRKSDKRVKLVELVRTRRTHVNNNGFVNGRPSYTFQVFLKPSEQFICKLVVKTSSKKITYENWDKLDFVLPCFIWNLVVDSYMLQKRTFNLMLRKDYETDSKSRSIIKNDGNKEPVFKILPFETPLTKKVFGYKLINVSTEELRMTITINLESQDETTGFIFLQNISKIGGDSNGK